MRLNNRWILSVVILSISAFSSAYAMEDKPLAAAEALEQKGLRTLKSEFKDAQKAFRAQFNDEVEDKRFKVVCKKKKNRFSNIITRTCKPAYYWSELHDRSEQGFWFGFVLPTEQGVEALTYREEDEYNKVLTAMLKKNPELRDKFMAFLTTQNTYLNAHVLKYGEYSKYKNELKQSDARLKDALAKFTQ